MLEGLVATLLNRFLGMYIQNFDPKQLNIGIWSGDVQLRNLELRKEALDQMKLPLNVVEGHLGKLTLSIPWSNLKGKPVRVLIEDIFLLAAPKADQEYDEEEEERRMQRVKQEKLHSAELINERPTAGMSEEEQKKNQSFMESLITKIVDNLQVTVKNIHIRYEDTISAPGHPFALGFTLEEFSAVSTNKDWQPSFLVDIHETTHKLAKLGALAIYWNTDAGLLSGKASHDMIISAFKNMIATGENTLSDHQFILKPVSGTGKIEMSKTSSPDIPRMKASLIFDEIGFILDEDQYRDALMMVDLFHFYIRHQQYKKFQPKGVKPKEDPKAWFRYAGNAILSQIHEKNRKWSWAYFEERRNDRKRYIELFKKLNRESLGLQEKEELDKLEWKLSYEDLRFYRSLARNQLKKERALVKKKETEDPKSQAQGWTSWLWGSSSAVTTEKQEEAHEDSVEMTDEQRKELYQAIDWDEKKAIADVIDLPRDTVKVQLETSLETGSFTLRRNPHKKQQDIVSLLFDTFKSKLLQRPDSFYGEVSLGGLRVYDGTTPGTLFPQIVRVKKSTESPPAEQGRIEELDQNHGEQLEEVKEESNPDEPFFQASFEQNPIDQHADSAMTMKMRSTEIIYNPRFIEEIVKFFKPPERHMESIGALLESAGATVEGIRQQTQSGLQFALEEHKTLDAKLDLQAPLIIMPESCTRKSTNCLILDVGHISVTSDLVPKEVIEQVKAKQARKYSQKDYEQLESLMYDKFKLSLHSTQVLIGPSIDDTLAQLSSGNQSRHFYIVDRINLDFLLQISILPKAPNLTKFKVSGHLPVLQASLSDSKYKALMRLIDAAVPTFDEGLGLNAKVVRQSTPKDLSRASQQNAFQFSTQKPELVLADEESVNGEDGEDKFEEASDGMPDGFSGIQQKTFELKFTVDKLQGSLFRADPEGDKREKELVTIVAEKFQLDFCIRTYDMAAEVVLQSFNIEDLIEENSPPDFRKIVTSDAFNSEPGKPLFLVKYVKVNPQSPEFMTIYEGIETNVDVSISTINVIITRKTVLTLLDFILTTFSASDTPTAVKKFKLEGEGDHEQAVESQITLSPTSDSKIRVKVDLKSIILILNHDGIRLATLSLNSADVGIFLRGNSMRLGARLGNFTLLDDINQGASENSSLRQLVSVQGNELADFRYETFDPQSPMSYPGYNSSIYLRSGSIKVNFVEEPFRKIIDFAIKFGQMQALFNAARQAAMNQANQIQNPEKIHFDVLIRTPIIVFPRAVAREGIVRGFITAYLGELYAQNKFVPLGDSEEAIIINKISTGIRQTRLTSEFHFDSGEKEELQMLDGLDLGFELGYTGHREDAKRPNLEVKSKMSDINMKLTKRQYKFLLELSQSIPSVFAGEPSDDEDIVHDLPTPDQPVAEGLASDSEANKKEESGPVADLHPEISVPPGIHMTLDLVFRVGQIGLELYDCEPDKPIEDLKAASLSRAYLDNTHVKLLMLSNGSLESELLIDSFNIKDSRKSGMNQFRNIMSSIHHEGSQFMANLRMSGGNEKNLVAIATIDSPQVIFALDYIFALKDWVMEGFPQEEAPLEAELATLEEEDEEDSAISTGDSQKSDKMKKVALMKKPPVKQESQLNISYRVNVVDSQVILIANPSSRSSEAIVLGTKQILLSQQHAFTLQVSEIGMFLCRMDKFDDNRLRVLDDFSIKVAMEESSDPGPLNTMTSIMVEVEPLVLRVSLRDILLVTQIFNKAAEMNAQPSGKKKTAESSAERVRTGTSAGQKSQGPPTERVSSAVKRKAKSLTRAQSSTSQKPGDIKRSLYATVRKEELKAEFEGMRVILIGDQHELPLIDLSVKRFTARLRDWTGEMTADLSIDTFCNIYNFSKSAWEPLIEPWNLGFHMKRRQNPDMLSIDLYSRKMLELTITPQTISLATNASQFMQQREDMLTKPRGAEAPYRIRNKTGYAINVWAVTESSISGEQMAVKLQDGEEAQWRFEEWEKMRENLSPDGASGLVGIKLEDTSYESIEELPVNREGESLYHLKLPQNNVLHRLLCEVNLGPDNVKYITFRSTLMIVNNTQIPIDLGILDQQHQNITRVYKVVPGESQPLPIEAAYYNAFVVRPDPGFGYDWSGDRLYWREVQQRPTFTFACRSTDPQNPTPFYFHLHANMPRRKVISRAYPYMKIVLSAPLEVENLLPYDFKFRVYDRQAKKEWTNFLRKKGTSPVHVVELSHLLLMSIDMQDTVYNQSEFAIINPNNTEYEREDSLVCKDMQGLILRLKLHYSPIPECGEAFRVGVYSPYVILNRIGMNIKVKSKAFLQNAKAAAGQLQSSGGPRQKPMPFLFSFPNDDRQNRAVLSVDGSQWSRPISFDAIGSATEIVLSSATKQNEELYVGMYVEEGKGKYKMSKIVTLTPRFVIKSKLNETLLVREWASPNVMELKPGELLPVYWMKAEGEKQLCFIYPGVNNSWTSPFNIEDLGNVHLKISRAGQRQRLLRIEILLEQATIYLHISMETKAWPFSIRNESRLEFTFYQASPYDEDEEDVCDTPWKPIKYLLPPRSIMPYAWDFPAGKGKELVLTCRGRERHVKLTEIGTLVPLKVPQENRGAAVIEIRVVADGPTNTLIISDYKASKSLYKPRHNTPGSSASTGSGFEVLDSDSGVTFKTQFKFAGIGVSLITPRLKELAYITLRDLELIYTESSMYQTFNIACKWIQVDNQLYGGIYPIVLYPSVVQKTGQELDVHPCLHANVTRVKNDAYGVLYIKYATFLLQEMTIEIDEDFIYTLLDFTKIFATNPEEGNATVWDEDLDIPEPKQQEAGMDVYFELLHIQPAQFDLSFARTEVVNVDDKASSQHNPLIFIANVLTMAIGNINDAPIRLNALMLDNARVSLPVLAQHVITHYKQQAVYQVHNIIGSADFLGNPVGLFNNISSGVLDIFYEPYRGLVMTDRPQELGIGIAKGATSFVKKSVFGVSDSLSKFTGSISKGLTAATLDKQFQDRRRMTRARNRPKHALYGVTQGAQSFATSLASGVGGVVRKPLEGAEKEGALGFLKGLGKGVVGVVTKPAIGIFDLASNVTEGIRNTTTVFDNDGLDRVRFTRFIPADGIVRPYSQREALGQFWLKQLDGGKYFNEEYIAHLDLQDDSVVMLTYSRIMLIKSRKLTTEWDIPFKELQTISKEETGIVLYQRGNREGPFIPLADVIRREFLYKKIELAVNQFNNIATMS